MLSRSGDSSPYPNSGDNLYLPPEEKVETEDQVEILVPPGVGDPQRTCTKQKMKNAACKTANFLTSNPWMLTLYFLVGLAGAGVAVTAGIAAFHDTGTLHELIGELDFLGKDSGAITAMAGGGVVAVVFGGGSLARTIYLAKKYMDEKKREREEANNFFDRHDEDFFKRFNKKGSPPPGSSSGLNDSPLVSGDDHGLSEGDIEAIKAAGTSDDDAGDASDGDGPHQDVGFGSKIMEQRLDGATAPAMGGEGNVRKEGDNYVLAGPIEPILVAPAAAAEAPSRSRKKTARPQSMPVVSVDDLRVLMHGGKKLAEEKDPALAAPDAGEKEVPVPAAPVEIKKEVPKLLSPEEEVNRIKKLFETSKKEEKEKAKRLAAEQKKAMPPAAAQPVAKPQPQQPQQQPGNEVFGLNKRTPQGRAAMRQWGAKIAPANPKYRVAKKN